MAVLRVENVTKGYGARVVLDGVSFAVGNGQKVALVGANGTGKSTLLKIMAGVEEPDTGEVSLAGGVRTGLLGQEPELRGEGTALEAVRGAFTEVLALEGRLRDLEREMAGAGESGALLAEYGRVLARYEAAGGYDVDYRARAALLGLGFREAELELPVAKLSGGQRSRAALARLLLTEPDLLLLDEPTNHLDLDALEWLEDTLTRFGGAVVVVSHDRYFLDRLAQHVLELEAGRVTRYAGNYRAYEAARAARMEQLEEERERYQEEVHRLEDYVRRYRAGNRARQAKSRERRLERLLREAPPASPRTTPGLSLAFSPEGAPGRLVVEAEGLAKGYGGRVLFSQVSFRVERGARVGVVGPNGAGKTTLLRLLLGLEPPAAGRVRWGAGVVPGYLPQSREAPENGATVLEACLDAADEAGRELTVGEARSLLARFLFRGDTVFQTVGSLSGGERARLALLRLVLSGANFLVLDEPTNHLDLPARRALEDAIAAFDGTVLLVSHDRRLLDAVCSHILVLDRASAVFVPGNYSAYRAWRDGKAPPAGRQEPEPARRGGPACRRPSRRAPARSGPAVGGDRATGVQAELEQLEAEIAALEARRTELERVLADPATYRSGSGGDLVREYREVEVKLEAGYRRWETLVERGRPQ